MYVACIGVVGLWDFGDFCSVVMFVSVWCMYDRRPFLDLWWGLYAGNLLSCKVSGLCHS